MLIQRDQTIAGFPAVPLRELMRELKSCAMSAEALRDRMEALNIDAHDAADRLIAAGLIEIAEHGTRLRSQTSDGRDGREATFYATTISGNALAKARIGKPMSRDKAEQLLADLLARVRAENDDPDGLFWIESVGLFGSYSDETKLLVGDIDVHLVYSHRYDVDEHDRRNQALIDAARAEGSAGPRSFFEHIGWAEDRLFKRLRARESRLDIHFATGRNRTLLPPGVTPRIVFTRQPHS